MVPISGLAGFGSAAVAGFEYRSIMASEGRAENFINLRLEDISLVSRSMRRLYLAQENLLHSAIVRRELCLKILETDLDFLI